MKTPKVKICESCRKPFPADKITVDGICQDCEEYWWEEAIQQANQTVNWRAVPERLFSIYEH